MEKRERFAQCLPGFTVRKFVASFFFYFVFSKLLFAAIPSEVFLFQVAFQELFSIRPCGFGFHIRKRLLSSGGKVIFSPINFRVLA